MNLYLISIERYFSGTETEEFSGNTKAEAVEKARKHFRAYGSGNYRLDTIKCVKKLRGNKR